MKKVLALFSMVMPWRMRAAILRTVFGYRIHPSSRIGFAWVFPANLTMEANARIGHLTVCKGLEHLAMGANASIGRLNWISGFPHSKTPSAHFAHQPDRCPALIMGEHSSVTHRHIIDCTNTVTIGSFTTVAGFRSQFLTHAIDLHNSQQSSAPITIGEYCFVGTGVICLPGSALPDRSVLGAGSVLNKHFTEPGHLYAGVSARQIKKIDVDTGYFTRDRGFVV